MQREVGYGKEISGWLSLHFPDLCSPSPHPACVAAVIRLHYLHGRGCLTVARHGEIVRRAAATWDERLAQLDESEAAS